jgi:hypothetical protein
MKDTAVYTLATGIKSWPKFAKLHQLVKLNYTKEIECEIELRERKNDNSYQNYQDEIINRIPHDATEEEIGNAIIEMYQHKM